MRSWPALDLRFPPRSPIPDPSSPLLSLPDRVSAALVDFQCTAVEELDASHWRISFRDAAERDRAGREFDRTFEGTGLAFTPIELPDEDWAMRSQRALGAIRVGRIVVAPPWDIPVGGPADSIIITIRPSMGFGTGHHASTRLCLMALQELPLAGTDVLDVGTGSGVLAIAAARLGARRVVGLDTDPDALESARDNVALNAMEKGVVLRVGDFRAEPLEPADLVLANLTGALLARSVGPLVGLVRPGGHLVVSGFGFSEEAEVVSALSHGGTFIRRDVEDEWLALTLRVTT